MNIKWNNTCIACIKALGPYSILLLFFLLVILLEFFIHLFKLRECWVLNVLYMYIQSIFLCSLPPPIAGAACMLICVWLFNPMNCSPQGSSACGIFQARILELVAISSSRGLLSPGLEPASMCLLHCIWIISCWATWEALSQLSAYKIWNLDLCF